MVARDQRVARDILRGRGRLTRRTALQLFAVGVGGVAIGACTSGPTAPAGTTTAPGGTAGQPKRGGILQVLGPASDQYDPHQVFTNPSTVPMSMIYEGLVETSTEGEIVPAIAESWTASEDGRSYTFKIRKGVKFHNGRELTPDDVKYSYDRIKDPETIHPRRSLWEAVTVRVAGDTVIFELPAPYAPLLANVSAVSAAIVPKEEVQRGSFDQNPVGTGPFRFKEYAPDEFLDLEAFADHWRGAPYLDGIRMIIVGDFQSKVARMRSLDADMLYDGPPENFPQMRDDPGFDVYGVKGQSYIGWFLVNPARVPAWRDLKVRQAVFHAIDRAGIAEAAYSGLATPTPGGFYPDNHWAAYKGDPIYPKQDLARARQLLSESGYPNGFELALFSSSALGFSRSAQVVQQNLQEIGIKANITVDPPGTNLLNSGDYEAYFHGHGPYADIDELISAAFTKGGGRAYTLDWSDPEVGGPDLVRLAEEGRRTPDQAKRAEIYAEFQRIVATRGWMAFVYNYNKYDVAQKYVKGYTYNVYVNEWREQARGMWLDK